MESKVMAYMMNTDYIEIDVLLSKDNQLIVCHDVVLDELTNIAKVFPNRSRSDSRYYIFDFTYDELKQLNVTERFTNWKNLTQQKFPDRFPLWKSNFHLHTFAEELELLEGLHKTYKLRNKSDNSVKNVSFLIEIKRPHLHRLNNKPFLSEILLQLLTKYGYNTDKSLIILQSFDPFELIHIKNVLKSPLRLVQLLVNSLDYEEEIGRIDYDYWNSPSGLRNISTFAVGKLVLIFFLGSLYIFFCCLRNCTGKKSTN
jgi:glycerophosphoryl diester phosphodiesterase